MSVIHVQDIAHVINYDLREYFRELLATNPDINEGLRSLLRLCRETMVRLQRTESALVRSLERDSMLRDCVEGLMTISVVGPITALTWALAVRDVQRFSSIKKAIGYCGLCGPLSKQRNKHLQTTRIEAAKLAPKTTRNWPCSMTRKGTRAMPIKLVAYLMAVDTFLWSAPKHGPTNSPKKPALTDAVRYLKLLREKSHSLARDSR